MQIGTLAAGAGTITVINRDQVDAYLLIGTVTQGPLLQGLTITIGGKVTQQVATTGAIQAIQKYLMESNLGGNLLIGYLLKIAQDFIPGQNVQYRLENSTANPHDIYAFSEGQTDQVPVVAGQLNINASSNQTFEGSGFTALTFPATNFEYVNLEFEDGHTSKLEGAEVDALFNLYNQADDDGRLANQHVIDNKEGDIVRATIFTTNGGNLLVTNIKLD